MLRIQKKKMCRTPVTYSKVAMWEKRLEILARTTIYNDKNCRKTKIHQRVGGKFQPISNIFSQIESFPQFSVWK